MANLPERDQDSRPLMIMKFLLKARDRFKAENFAKPAPHDYALLCRMGRDPDPRKSGRGHGIHFDPQARPLWSVRAAPACDLFCTSSISPFPSICEVSRPSLAMDGTLVGPGVQATAVPPRPSRPGPMGAFAAPPSAGRMTPRSPLS